MFLYTCLITYAYLLIYIICKYYVYYLRFIYIYIFTFKIVCTHISLHICIYIYVYLRLYRISISNHLTSTSISPKTYLHPYIHISTSTPMSISTWKCKHILSIPIYFFKYTHPYLYLYRMSRITFKVNPPSYQLVSPMVSSMNPCPWTIATSSLHQLFPKWNYHSLPFVGDLVSWLLTIVTYVTSSTVISLKSPSGALHSLPWIPAERQSHPGGYDSTDAGAQEELQGW